MRQRLQALSDNYRSAFLVAVLLIMGNAAFSQNYTSASAWGYKYKNVWVPETLSIPADTFAIPAPYQNQPFIAYKDSLIYLWSPSLHRWNTGGTISSTPGGGSGGVDFLTKQNFGDTATYDATRWWVLQQLNSYTPTTRFLDSMQAARFTYLKAGDTTYLHNQLIKLSTNNAANSNLLFTNGLVYSSVTNQVSALFQSPIWNANRFQGYPVDAVICNGCVPYLDSANRMIRWRLPDSATVAPIYDSIAQINLDLLATKLALHDSANRIWDKLNNIGIYFDSTDFEVAPAGPIAGDKDSVRISALRRAQIEYVTAPGNFVPYPDFTDTTNNLRDAIAAVWANFSNYYTKTESDARFYPLDLNPKGYLTAVPATDDPYRIDSSKVTGTTNKTITNYYHNGTTYSYSFVDLTALAVTQNNFNNYVVTATGTGSLQGEPDFQYDDVLNYLSLGGTVHPDFRLISTGYVNGMTSRIAPNVAGRIFGASKGGMNLQGYSDSLRYPGLRLQGYMSSTTGANVAPITMESFRPGTTYYRQKLGNSDTAFSMYSGARDSAGVLLMSMLGNGNMYVAGTVYGPGGTPIGNNYTFSNSSIVNTGGNLALAGDAATPAANTVYGVDASGAKGFRATTSIDMSNMFVGDGVKYAGNGAFVRRPRFTVISTGTGGTASLDSNANALTINFTASSTNITSTDNYINASGSTINTRKAWNAITWASSITVNAATSSNHTVTLGGATAITISNPQDGQVILLELIQDATGSRTVTWPSDVDWSWTATGSQPTLKTAAGAPNAITLTYKSATAKWYGTY